ncbi:unnamed protein product, partial [Prorocentrum cordatum]
MADALHASAGGAPLPGAMPSDRTRYWTDANYSRFYAVSQEERRCIKTAAAGAGLSPGGALRMGAAWKASGVGEPPRSLSARWRPGAPTEGRLALFQVRPLLLSMQVVLDAGASRGLQEALLGAGDLVSYREALAIYLALAPGRAGAWSPREARAAVEAAVRSALEEEGADGGAPLSARRARPAGAWSRPLSPLDAELAVAAAVGGALRELEAEDVEGGVVAERVSPGGGGWTPDPPCRPSGCQQRPRSPPSAGPAGRCRRCCGGSGWCALLPRAARGRRCSRLGTPGPGAAEGPKIGLPSVPLAEVRCSSGGGDRTFLHVPTLTLRRNSSKLRC